jgi:tripartite-type tricarboxylate transporter receptor subunit TctC
MRRKIVLGIFAALLLACGTAQAQQGTYPNHQVRIIVPYPPGGPTDLIGRIVAQKLGERLGQSFFVENVSGASGAVGAGQVAHSAPDGYTLLVTTNDFAVSSVTNTNLPYDPLKDFSPVTIISTSPQVVAVNPAVPAKNIRELADLIKASPEKYNYAAMGIGFGQLTAERLFNLSLKLNGLARVPFNGAAPAINSTLAGDTQIIFIGLPPVAPYLTSDKLRAIAVTSPERTPVFPDVPTLRESGVPDQEADLINGMLAPAGTSHEIIALLQKQIAEIVRLPDVKATFDKLTFVPAGTTPEQYASQIREDITVWGKVMKDAHIPVN